MSLHLPLTIKAYLLHNPPPYFIGVLGSFFRGGQQFVSAKIQSCSAKKNPLRGGQVFKFCSAKQIYHSFESHCSASLNIWQKVLNDD